MTIDDFKAILNERRVLLDGAMGTDVMRLCTSEGSTEQRFQPHEACLTHPSVVVDIHNQYIKAGADIVTSNTFMANALVCCKGAELAKAAARQSQRRVFVAGSLGPIQGISPGEKNRAYVERISSLLEGGADIIMFETVLDTPTLYIGLTAANDVAKDTPVMVSATVTRDTGLLLSGEPLSALIDAVSRYDNVVSVGLNCGYGPLDLCLHLPKLRELTTLPLSVHPNAGVPLGCTPEAFASSLTRALEIEQLRVIGGCCGTTPAHIAALRSKLRC